MADSETHELITLPDQTVLDQRQSTAIALYVEGNLSTSAIAERAGYASAATLNTFLRSERGKAGVQVASTHLLSSLGGLAIRTQKSLMRKAKSERVRLEASELILMRLERLGALQTMVGGEQDAGHGSQRAVNINISLNGPAEGATIDGNFSAKDPGKGAGGKTAAAGGGDPARPDIVQDAETIGDD